MAHASLDIHVSNTDRCVVTCSWYSHWMYFWQNWWFGAQGRAISAWTIWIDLALAGCWTVVSRQRRWVKIDPPVSVFNLFSHPTQMLEDRMTPKESWRKRPPLPTCLRSHCVWDSCYGMLWDGVGTPLLDSFVPMFHCQMDSYGTEAAW